MNTDTRPKPAHDCGLCDGPIQHVGYESAYDSTTPPVWVCLDDECGWWHTSRDCCYGFETEGAS